MPDVTDTPLHKIRADLIERLRAYEDGILTTQTRAADGAVDTTSDTIAHIRANIAELDRVIEGLPRS
jgi:predicted transcriptional regulator